MPPLTDPATTLILWAALGYLAGSVPFGVLITRVLNLGDLRRIGSGNIGATNVLRTGNRGAALATLVLDGGKGAVGGLGARAVAGEGAVQIAALAAFLGHCYPVWLGFRGGKGVSTLLGILLALAWPLGLAACATWAAVAAIFRYSSLASMMAAGLSPVWALLLGQGAAAGRCVVRGRRVHRRPGADIAPPRAGPAP
ncbi:MAG: glycerol-3-phosphate acyltransferase, partial [Rubellimicrobium sp.]|nr:glycerol-3-phosphate acyltransferase [Rubellimicrobium sp.]